LPYERGFADGEYQDGEIRGLVFLAGQRGMGKTTEMARLLDSCEGGALFFDSLGKHGGLFPNWLVISEPRHLVEYFRRYAFTRFRLLYQPRAGSVDWHFDKVCRIVAAIGWMVLGVDELDKVTGSRFGTSSMPEGFYNLVNYGRHDRIALLATARTPPQVPRGFTSETASMRLFRLHESRYVKYFEEFIGSENASMLPGLARFEYLLWDGEGDGLAQLCGGGTVVRGLRNYRIKAGAAL
jgi:hypothetical protein